MPISRNKARNSAALVSALRIRVNLCCTRGWSITMTCAMEASLSVGQGTAKGPGWFRGVGPSPLTVVASSDFRRHLNMRIRRDTLIRQGNALDNPDARVRDGVILNVTHRYQAVNFAYAQPVQDVRHEF